MIIWIDGPFGVGKSAVANMLKERHSNMDVIDFDKFVRETELSFDNKLEVIFGERYPQSKRVYLDLFTKELESRLRLNKDKVLLVPISLINDFCKTILVEEFKNKTDTVHIILCASLDEVLKRIKKQEGRDEDLVNTYYNCATCFLIKNYPDAIRIQTDKMKIDEVVYSIESKVKLGD